jgi:hypothetical protein
VKTVPITGEEPETLVEIVTNLLKGLDRSELKCVVLDDLQLSFSPFLNTKSLFHYLLTFLDRI